MAKPVKRKIAANPKKASPKKNAVKRPKAASRKAKPVNKPLSKKPAAPRKEAEAGKLPMKKPEVKAEGKPAPAPQEPKQPGVKLIDPEFYRKGPKKIEVLEMLNDGEENYFRLRVATEKGQEAIEALVAILDALELREFRTDEPDEKPERKAFPDFVPVDYSRWVGQHRFFSNPAFKAHIIFSQGVIHMIVKCTFYDRDRLMEVINGFCSWAKKV